jgi:Zn ribbon nucleic-acid-binding protein
MNFFCDTWYWRASDQEAVARHLMGRAPTTGARGASRRRGLVRSALLSILRIAGLAEQAVETSPVEREEIPQRECCDCGGEEEFQYRQAVLDDGEWVLRCPECGHLDRLLWLSEEARALLVGLARRRWRVQVRRM